MQPCSNSSWLVNPIISLFSFPPSQSLEEEEEEEEEEEGERKKIITLPVLEHMCVYVCSNRVKHVNIAC